MLTKYLLMLDISKGIKTSTTTKMYSLMESKIQKGQGTGGPLPGTQVSPLPLDFHMVASFLPVSLRS